MKRVLSSLVTGRGLEVRHPGHATMWGGYHWFYFLFSVGVGNVWWSRGLRTGNVWFLWCWRCSDVSCLSQVPVLVKYLFILFSPTGTLWAVCVLVDTYGSITSDVTSQQFSLPMSFILLPQPPWVRCSRDDSTVLDIEVSSPLTFML